MRLHGLAKVRNEADIVQRFVRPKLQRCNGPGGIAPAPTEIAAGFLPASAQRFFC